VPAGGRQQAGVAAADTGAGPLAQAGYTLFFLFSEHAEMRTPKFLSVLCLPVLLAGCATQAPEPLIAECAQDLTRFEAIAQSRDVTLSEPRSVAAYPALGSNRLLAGFDPEKLSEPERQAWLARLLAAGRERRELLRLMLDARGAAPSEPELSAAALERCAAAEVAALPRTATTWQALHAAVQVPDDYLTVRRVLGVYPLTSLAAKAGIKRLQRDIHEMFAAPLENLPVVGQLQRYEPVSGSGARGEPQLAADTLGPLTADSPALQALFARHAPVWEIDIAGDYDRPGAPYVDRDGEPRVDAGTPVVFRYASATRFAGALRLQLNYLVWFDQRPPQGALDTLSGRLDGLLWRVTLDDSGRALLYDSVHPCGCYQLFFPAAQLQLRDTALSLPEPPLVPQGAPAVAAGERVVLRVSSGEHFIQRVYADQSQHAGEPSHPYGLEPYESLYGVRHPDGPRSLFDRYGIVAGTERGERWYLWPMGIRSPGAMRERGRHATAFVGRRHLDDPALFDRFFRMPEED
jgi:hypothetical protein